MYYMLASANNNKIASKSSLNGISSTNSSTASDVPGQNLETTHVSQASVKKESSALSDLSVVGPGYDSAYDSEAKDSAILLNDSDSAESLIDPTDEEPTLDDKPFAIKEIIGKGTGIIATREIKRGERVLIEKPLIRHARNFDDFDIIKTYDKLAKKEKAQISELCNVRPARIHPIIGIIWTNSISISRQESGLFITASRFNHACVPNACHSWNSDLTAITIHATADIREGEEITNSYLEGAGSWAARRTVLARDFGFNCDCHCCKLVDVERKQSDKCFKRIGVLEQKLEFALPFKKPVDAGFPDISLLADAQKLLSLYEEEGISDSRLAKPYVYAWRLALRNNLGRRIVESSKRAWEIFTMVNGDDHPDALFWREKHERCREHMSRPEVTSLETPLKEDEDRDVWLFWGRKGE